MDTATNSSSRRDRSFLGAVARAYSDRYDDLSEFCFVFPNRRAGTFFVKRLAEVADGKPRFTPQIESISDFVAILADHDVDSRIDLIFRLYGVYCKIKGVPVDLASEQGALDFDRFAPWGEIIVNDFSEVDKYRVDADKLFYNVRILRDIESNYLTDEQLDVIERFFGYRPRRDDVEGFWKNFGVPALEGDEADSSDLRNKFAELWQLLPELYEGLRAELDAERLCMPGSAFRLALDRVLEHGEDVLRWRKVVFVGFNSISTTEQLLFSELQSYAADDGSDYAEFLWDITGPVLTQPHGNASHELLRNRKNFPDPEWVLPYLSLAAKEDMPARIDVLASPSNSAQTKLAGKRVAELLEEIGQEKISDARVAVVLPDENLLLPLLYSLPSTLREVNLTMGYAMRFTAVASLITHLRRLQSRYRQLPDGDFSFYHADISLLTAHPLVHSYIGPDAANRINGFMSRYRLFNISLSKIAEFSERFAYILRPLAKDATVDQTIGYLDDVLVHIDERLAEDEDRRSRLERSHILLYRTAMSRLLDAVHEHHIQMCPDNVFRLTDRLLAGEQIRFEGEPLEGLQVMGLLETRALDFDHLIVLSMNDKVMPRRGASRTFIPDSLRRGYGMPPGNYAENLYSYYFYRMLSRTDDVTLIYDARAGEGMRSGGRSRFLMQLEMVYARDRINTRRYTYRYNGRDPKPNDIVKTPEVMAKLNLLRTPASKLNLSASALNRYCDCPVKFYYECVEKIDTDSEPDKYVDALTQGNVVHHIMLDLYAPRPEDRYRYLKNPIVLDADFFDAVLNDRDGLMRRVRRQLNIDFYRMSEAKGDNLDKPLPPGVEMVAEHIADDIENILRYDRSQAPVHIVGCEIPASVVGDSPVEDLSWRPGPDAQAVNISYSFDRVDRVGNSFRVIDYKTGSVGNRFRMYDFSSVLDHDKNSKTVLQLLLYCKLLATRIAAEEGLENVPITPLIYDTSKIASDGPIRLENGLPTETKSGKPKTSWVKVDDYRVLEPQLTNELTRMFNEIFDPETPLRAKTNNCSYCTLQALCGR